MILKEERNFDICIVGAGMVGLSLAYQLCKRNITKKIIIIEKVSIFNIDPIKRIVEVTLLISSPKKLLEFPLPKELKPVNNSNESNAVFPI